MLLLLLASSCAQDTIVYAGGDGGGALDAGLLPDTPPGVASHSDTGAEDGGRLDSDVSDSLGADTPAPQDAGTPSDLGPIDLGGADAGLSRDVAGDAGGAVDTGGPGPLCVPNGDERVVAAEMPVVPELSPSVLYSVNRPETIVDVPDPDGVWDEGTLRWDLAAFDPDRDHVVQDALLPPADFWFGQDFPDAQYASAMDAEGATLGLYRLDASGEALLLLGMASLQEGETLLRYETPIPALRFPLERGVAWEALEVEAHGTHDGVTYPFGTLRLSHDYVFTVDRVGAMSVPAGDFLVLRVALDFTARAENLGIPVAAERRTTYLWVAECVGLVARVRSVADELDPGFRRATEYRRLGFPPGVGLETGP